MPYEYFLNNYIYSYNTIGNFLVGFGLAFLMHQFLVFITILIQVAAEVKYGREVTFDFGASFKFYGLPGLFFLALGFSLKHW